MLGDLTCAIEPLRLTPLKRMLDIGCGFGGLAAFVGQALQIPEIHGVDKDEQALEEARHKMVRTHLVDVSEIALPFPDSYFDLTISFGMLDYLPCYDQLLREIGRVTRARGYVLISLPNLASWHNRIAMLLGYQPRDVEVSQEILPGVHPWYKKRREIPVGHIHTVTTSAFRELMTHHGFEPTRVTGAVPRGRISSYRLSGLIDKVFARRPTLARRFFYLGCKSTQLEQENVEHSAPTVHVTGSPI
jgi:ubiquinone/menaquinone biosynthesis C-methylase UbiE